MWKFLKFIGWVLKAAVWFCVVAALLALAALYLLERGIPAPVVARLAEACSDGDYLCRIGRATFGLRSGLRLYSVSLSPLRSAEGPLVSADEIRADLRLSPFAEPADRLQALTIRNLRFPSLPPRKRKDAPAPTGADAPAAPLAPAAAPAAPARPTLPTVSPFALTLDGAQVLGLEVARLSATVASAPSRATVSDVRLDWPDTLPPMSLTGHVEADLAAGAVRGAVKGLTRPANILPLLVSLRARGAVKQVNCFTQVENPVAAEASFDVDLATRDFVLVLNLDVGPCRYRDVPMTFARGTVTVCETNIYTTVKVGPLQAESRSGPLSGRLLYREEGESLEVDARAHMDLDDLANVINILNRGQLKPVRCTTPVSLSIQGLAALDARKSTVTNALTGRLSFGSGSVFNLPVHDVSGDLEIAGFSASIGRVSATPKSGGALTGGVTFTFPDYAASSTVFHAYATFTDLALADLSRTVNATNTRGGSVTGELALSGSTDGPTLPSLSGSGSATVKEALLNRMPLFAGFTDYLASNIPGVSSLVNQSNGSLTFTITNGRLRTRNLLIEGDLFSLQGQGTYDLNTEVLDFVMRANIFRQRSIAGRLTRLVTLPFSRLLLEFKVHGTRDRPEWSYANILERIADGISDIKTPFAPNPQTPPANPPQRP